VKLDDSKIRNALTSIHSGTLTRDDASAIIDVARFAASVDGRMDMGEMATVARLSKIVYAMGGEADAPVPSTPMSASWLAELGTKLVESGPRELAYASARLVILVDRKVTKEETDMTAKLTASLRISPARAQELEQIIDSLIK
jgi:hypothetical protein